MQSPTHSLIALAALSQKTDGKRNWAVFIGSVIPDAFIYVCWLWLTFVQREPQSRIWNEIYFDVPMQITASLFNSIPLYLGLAAIGWVMRAKIWGKLVLFFALAALIHIAFDLPVHNDDAYAYFKPFTDWRFISPLSYWDIDHHAGIISVIESIIGIASIIILWRRFPKLWVKLLLLLLGLLYAAIMLARLMPVNIPS
jgi:hypothetical protein